MKFEKKQAIRRPTEIVNQEIVRYGTTHCGWTFGTRHGETNPLELSPHFPWPHQESFGLPSVVVCFFCTRRMFDIVMDYFKFYATSPTKNSLRLRVKMIFSKIQESSSSRSRTMATRWWISYWDFIHWRLQMKCFGNTKHFKGVWPFGRSALQTGSYQISHLKWRKMISTSQDREEKQKWRRLYVIAVAIRWQWWVFTAFDVLAKCVPVGFKTIERRLECCHLRKLECPIMTLTYTIFYS